MRSNNEVGKPQLIVFNLVSYCHNKEEFRDAIYLP